MLKVLLLLAGLALATRIQSIHGEYNFYFNDTTYLESFGSVSPERSYFRSYYHPLFDQTVGFLKNLSESDALSRPCRSSLERWTRGIEAGELWAVKFLESTGRTITGKLTGDRFDCKPFSINS